MPSFRTGVVTALVSGRAGLQRVLVDGEAAYVLTELIGPVAVGDRVVINTVAVDLGLGTGGSHVVHWNLAREEWQAPGGGHVLKLRYTSLQTDVGVAEEDGDSDGELDGTPVVAIGLHSQLAPVAVAFADAAPGRRLVYVMTEGGALPLALSDLVADLTDRRLLAATVTAGQAFGGTLEAVNVPSALAMARHRLGADAIVAGTGPGVVGTGTRLGTSAAEVASILDVSAAIGATPVLCARASGADDRDRHRGLSHHARTALELVRSPVIVPVAGGWGIEVDDQREVAVPDMAALLDAAGVAVTTMGRGPQDDPLFFAMAGAAGVMAAGLIDRTNR